MVTVQRLVCFQTATMIVGAPRYKRAASAKMALSEPPPGNVLCRRTVVVDCLITRLSYRWDMSLLQRTVRQSMSASSHSPALM